VPLAGVTKDTNALFQAVPQKALVEAEQDAKATVAVADASTEDTDGFDETDDEITDWTRKENSSKSGFHIQVK